MTDERELELLQEMKAIKEEKDEEIASLKQTISEKNSLISGYEEELTLYSDSKKLAEDLKVSNRKVTDLTTELNRLKSEYKTKNEELKQKEADLNTKAGDLADKENELNAQEARIQQEIEEKGKSLVQNEIDRLNRENKATEKVLANKQRILDEKIKSAEEELEKAEEATKKREKELFVPAIRYMAIIFATLVVLFGHWAWWGYKVGVADDYSEMVIGQKQTTIKHLFRKDEIKTVDDTQRYTKALVQADYDLKKKKKNTTVNDRVLKALAVSWRNLEFKPQEEEPKEQKDKSDQTQAKQQGKQEQPKKQDKQAKPKTQAVAKPKPATAKDIKTIEAVQNGEQPRQSETPATGLQASTPEQQEADRATIEKAKKEYYYQKLQEIKEGGLLE